MSPNEIQDRLKKHRKKQYKDAALATFPKSQQTAEVLKSIDAAAEVFANDVATEIQLIQSMMKIWLPKTFTTPQGNLIPIA